MEIGNGRQNAPYWPVATAVAVASLCALFLGISILVPREGLDH